MAHMKTQTKVITTHIPIDLAEKVDDLSERLERSRAWIVKQALSTWVAQEEEHYRLTLEALEDVDTNKTIDHDAVQTWANSLTTDKPLPLPKSESESESECD